jgi:hypothetical protein
MAEGADAKPPLLFFAHENHFTSRGPVAASHDNGTNRDHHKKQDACKKGRARQESGDEIGLEEGGPQPRASDYLA